MIGIRIEFLIQEIHFFDWDTVREHEVRVERAILDLFEEFFPVHVDGGLAVADEADAALHKGADVEVVCLLKGDERLIVVLQRGNGVEVV